MIDKDWQEQLQRDYPEIYGDVSISCPPGWARLLRELGSALQAIPDLNIKVIQVKEKFGGLRFYYNCYMEKDQLVEMAIADAEGKSYNTCEWCGEPGSVKGSEGWVRTLCPPCREKEKGGWRWWRDE